jgi:glycolate oxidase FAD binding subunit
MQHVIDQLAEAIRDAGARKALLRIRGGGSKDFYGGRLRGDVLDTRVCSGIVDYEPTELVITARAGTPLAEVEAALRSRGQMLGFEPPHFAEGATLGGAIAAGLSGPRRAYAGSVRDFVLGVRILDGNGTDLRFGGQVMKNVAGYDVSRLIVGSLGTLAVLTEISLKVLPAPAMEITLRQECAQVAALERFSSWAGRPYPVSATVHLGEALFVRLSGAEPAVRGALARIGGDEIADGSAVWNAVREHKHAFFQSPTLWRLSVKPTAAPFPVDAPQLVEWGGALRWIAGEVAPAVARETAARTGGHATLFRGGDKAAGVFQPLPTALMQLHQRLKKTFDPHAIFGPGRMYPDL